LSDPTGWLAAKPNAPLSTAGALSALAVAPAFLLLVNNSILFTSLGFAKLVLVSVALGLPVLSLCGGLCIVMLHAVAEWDRPLPTTASLRPFILEIAREPRLEWEGLWLGAGLANLIFYGLAARASFAHFYLGRTLLLVALVLAGGMFVCILTLTLLLFLHRRKLLR
jgi:hypothetical protein